VLINAGLAAGTEVVVPPPYKQDLVNAGAIIMDQPAHVLAISLQDGISRVLMIFAETLRDALLNQTMQQRQHKAPQAW
jgi:hypothetical protein